ncbi:probable cationic amino acid transporter [Tigriopus californicus]|uniref:probable cationic amino acid transporter n=1 Tax=Tigriopus californicus TaxID=6832 RepID=UPI0027DA3AEB|nr:probable cationic amino acid transporter [Tigriopus californicus]|eukprot:TCALIF_05890-PA protein Name:"Similar to SLC7A14 Probable cationic amino acid transporter (Homo sapiens)" AED:0.10 eAED:0.10 QI:95/0.57/0.37/1/1/1/8/0/628
MNLEVEDAEIGNSSGVENGNNSQPIGANASGTHTYSRLKKKLFKLKNLHELQDTEANNDDSQLKKVLGTKDLISLGIGSCVGTGMYLVSGLVAKKVAGPGVVISYLIAGFAALLSGSCYAELAVRVPHTTGSAYVYSYVTVGEFIAFIIGWNMILEYVIGTAACARALSICLDILTDGALANITTAWAGPPEEGAEASPDLIALVITLLMMCLFFYGVKKSVLFNHVLNIVNVWSWGLIIVVGLGTIDFRNWSEFMPYGLSGVMKGAATCFYAFIGFDIIATTGEETQTPKQSIPKAILVSLTVVTLAYGSCASIMTLSVPYSELSEDSGLIQIWGQMNMPTMEWIVSIGALAAFIASMFGSMFPLPRIAYAMANDGLLCQSFKRVNKYGVPGYATLMLGLFAALCAFFFPLEVLIEMMSIGTLLAYTLVNACVLLLRFQPSLESPFSEFTQDTNLDKMVPADDDLPENAASDGQPMTVLDRFAFAKDLVNGCNSHQLAKDCTKEGGKLVTKVLLSMVCCIILFDFLMVYSEVYEEGLSVISILLFIVALVVICHIISLAKFPQKRPKGFNVAGVPLVPSIGILINIYLMMRLSPVTWIRFTIWMIFGLLVYFKYGLLDSSFQDIPSS